LRRYYGDLGLEDLHGELWNGRLRTYEDVAVEEVINGVLEIRNTGAAAIGVLGYWLLSIRSSRVLLTAGFKPISCSHLCINRTASIKAHGYMLIMDLFIPVTTFDIADLCLNPTGTAMILCVDEKMRIRSLDQIPSFQPMGLGCVRS
jgi:hypothetical protein